MFKFIFFDLDDTILDFHAAERVAYAKALAEHSIEKTQELLDRYHVINLAWWEKLDRGEVDRDTLLVERHRELFAALGIDADPAAFEASYRKWLGVGHWFLPDAVETLDYLKEKGYRLYIASNGVIDTQYSRLESAGIGPYFDGIFISEELGFHKPEPAFFEACFARIPAFDPALAILIGDSLSSDIRGAKNAGIASVWLNRNGKTAPPELAPDFEIHALHELWGIL